MIATILIHIAMYLLTGVLVAAFAQWLQSNHSDNHVPLDDTEVITVLLLWPVYLAIALGAAVYFYTLAAISWVAEKLS